ncbi:MAG: ESX secretion-associated protein EspG, partial [Actinobacteria bacterium]|nr:ESX secretion-associated protein EspG [Actinomycetota bacterium]
RFRTMLQGPKLGGGKFSAAWRDRHGSRRVAEFVVTYYETERGGYTIEQKRGVDGSRWYTLAPAARPQLAQRLAHLLDSIRI